MTPQTPNSLSQPDPSAWGEPQRIERARAGDQAALEGLLRHHYPRIHALAFRLLGNPEDAEDLAQECFVRAFRSLAHYRGEGSFAGWLRRILVHLAQDRYRSQGQRPEPMALTSEHAGGGDPHTQLEGRELRLTVADAVQSLAVPLRTALLLRTREGLGYEEIAALTGVTAETVRTRVMKARKVLLRLVGPYLSGRDAGRALRRVP